MLTIVTNGAQSPQLQEKREPSGSVRNNRCDRFRDDRLGNNIDHRFCPRQDELDRVALSLPDRCF